MQHTPLKQVTREPGTFKKGCTTLGGEHMALCRPYLAVDTVRMVTLRALGTRQEMTLSTTAKAPTDHTHVLSGRKEREASRKAGQSRECPFHTAYHYDNMLPILQSKHLKTTKIGMPTSKKCCTRASE